MHDLSDQDIRINDEDANRLTEILNLWPCLACDIVTEIHLSTGQVVPTEAEERLVRMIDYIEEEQITDDSEIDVNALFLKPFSYPHDHDISLNRDEALAEIKQIGLDQQIAGRLRRIATLEGELVYEKSILGALTRG